MIEVELAHLGADLGQHQIHHRRLQVVDGVVGPLVLQQLPVDDRIHLNGDVVAGDALLRRNVEHPLLQGLMADHPLHHGEHQGEAGLQLPVVLAEPLHQAGLAAAGDLDGVQPQKGHHHEGR